MLPSPLAGAFDKNAVLHTNSGGCTKSGGMGQTTDKVPDTFSVLFSVLLNVANSDWLAVAVCSRIRTCRDWTLLPRPISPPRPPQG